MKDRDQSPQLVQDICKRLKSQLEDLSTKSEKIETDPETERLKTLFVSLKQKLSELSR
jgi:hypothetical protein